MPGTNLTREEAQTRAGLLSVASYTIDLDLTVANQDGVTAISGSATAAVA